jgi:hypothetical protein
MRIIISIILSLVFATSMAQFHKKKGPQFEVNGGVGVTPVFADIGNLSLGPAITTGFRYRLGDHSSLKLNVHSSIFLGDDLGTDNNDRGLDYMTIIVEPALQYEYTFFKEKKSSNRKGKMTMRPKVRPYIFAGGGGVYFMPEVSGEDLSEVTTDYSKFSIVMVGGAGFLHHFQSHWLWGVELGGRYLMTDYLDGFSPESSKSSDMYNFVTINLVYRWRYSAIRK